MKVEIKHRFTEAVLFTAEISDDVESGLQMRAALEKATGARADLSGAYLRSADLSGAYLRSADLRGANLRSADLRGAYLRSADLRDADLRGADLRGADLSGADLRGADLSGAYLSGKKLVGDRPILQIGPIGSRSDYLVAYITDAGVMLKTGCFFGTVPEFEARLESAHNGNRHGIEYRSALAMIAVLAEQWGVKNES